MNQYTLVLVILLVGAMAVVIAIRRAGLRKSDYESERALTRLMVKLHAGMIVVSDTEGRFLVASELFDDRFRSAPNEKVRPESVYGILDERSRYDYRNMIKYAFENNKAIRDFRVATVTDDHTREQLLTVIPVFAARGRRVGLINEFASPDKLTGIGADFERLEKLTNVGQIAAGIAHELNTPLGSIILSADIITEMDRSAPLQEEARKIKRQATHCSTVVKELLRYVKKDERIKERCGIGTIVTRVRSLVEPELGAQNITLDLQIDTEEDTILCDENQIEQLFFNLFSNSIYAIGAGGRIGVTVNLDAILNQLVITFEDDGGGIAPENMARIFDPFFTTKPGIKGTGLGLALCKRIVLDHDGRIEARSEPGKGAIFTLRFPVAS